MLFAMTSEKWMKRTEREERKKGRKVPSRPNSLSVTSITEGFSKLNILSGNIYIYRSLELKCLQ